MSDEIACPAVRILHESQVCDMEYCFCMNGGKLYKEGDSAFHKCKYLNLIEEEIELAMLKD